MTKAGTIKVDMIKIGIIQYILIMLVFSIPILVVGWWTTRDNSYMMMPIMFILVYGMISINDRIKVKN